MGRVEWLRSAGFSYADFERAGYGFVVAEAFICYKKPARFDEKIVLKTNLSALGRVSLEFEYEVVRTREVLATGKTRHGCVDLSTGRPARIPEGLGIQSGGKPFE